MNAALPPPRRQALPIAIMLLALALCAAGVSMAVAGAARFQADAFLQDWAGKAAEPEMRAWQVAAAAAQHAVAWYPAGNGDYLDRSGRVYSWQFYRQPHGSAQMLTPLLPAAQAAVIDGSRRQALAMYRAAVALRPAKPDGWARLAHAKLYLRQVDAEFAAAYARAAQLGPWRPDVNLDLASIGFQAWPSLKDPQRELALEQGVRAAGNGRAAARAVEQLAFQAGLGPLFCERATARQVQGLVVCR